MHPMHFENSFQTTRFADFHIGVCFITSLLSDIPKLQRLVSRKSDSTAESMNATSSNDGRRVTRKQKAHPTLQTLSSPIPSAALSVVVAPMANTQYRILKKRGLVHHTSE